MTATTSLSSRERYLTALAHQEPDRVPIHVNMQFQYYHNDRIRWENLRAYAEAAKECTY